tara:strand:- start:40222 stop:41415 length:1194 start_codon:yes stop_codon:yes gene_type:complete
MNFCKRCVYPEYAVNLDVSDDGICSSCKVFEEINNISDEEWKLRENKLIQIIEKQKKNNKSYYDCLIPVGGGKDSYWQVHKIKELGFNPLLVTYHGNNYYPEGQKNLDRMREVFNCDHYIFYPGVETLIKLNRAGFKKMGDMNWHNHAGIRIIPAQFAVKFNVPIFIWGETAWDISGMYSPDDYVEYNKKMVLEHDMRGYTRKDMIGCEGITEEEMHWCRMPSDEEFSKSNLRGLYLGNYQKWNPYKQVSIIKKLYHWEEAREPFQRTYRTISNLDDMHENGVHDYMKWIKFGYGRCSDHVSKDIRNGDITREEGIKLIKKYDQVKPTKDLSRWLKYVQMSEEEFDTIADTFRDPNIWKIYDKKWWKYDINNKPEFFGNIKLKDENLIHNYIEEPKL